MMEFKEAALFEDGPTKATTSPIVTGSSVLAVKYKDGVMMMADTLGSYGGLAMFKKLPRIQAINASSIIGAGGEYSDFQQIMKLLNQQVKKDFCYNDGCILSPSELHSYLSRLLYARRSKVDPLWNTLLLGGIESDGSHFLGCVDIYGSCYTGNVLATGFGQHLAIPLLRSKARIDMSYDDAKQLLEDCQRVLIYRDCRTINLFQLATITTQGPNISTPYSIETQWEFKRMINPGDTQ